MKSQVYFGSFFASLILSFLLATHFAPINTIAKFTPPPWNVFVGYYGDHNAIHRIIYHGLFSFGKRMQEADVLILGNSHAELGLSAEKISEQLSARVGKPIKVMNLGVGWGEPYVFHKQVLEHNKLHDKTLLIEVFETLYSETMSLIARPVLQESKLASYSHVFETWLLAYRDWLLDGVLPRVTLINSQFTLDRFLAYPIGFRQWKNGDVWDYWFPYYGQIYQKTPAKLVTYPIMTNKKKGDIALFNRILDTSFLNHHHFHIITTFVPANQDYEYYVSPPKKLGLTFLDIPNKGIELYDQAHTNSAGREAATMGLLNKWVKNKVAMQSLS